MRLTHCVVCGTTASERVFSVDRVPIHPFTPPAGLGLAPGFGTLEIVACAACGHLYNAAFDASRVDDLYAAAVLTNTPVSEGMIRSLETTAEYILSAAPPDPVIADVGGGTGVLSRTMARRAREVHLIEPSRALRAEDFAGTGVTLHGSSFPAPALAGRLFDVIVARQVVEHIPEPLPFLQALRAHLHERGVVYLEIPSAEYIERTRSILDFHYPHVHYYRRAWFETLLRRAGFEVIDVTDVKDFHDRGFLLRAATPAATAAPPPPIDRGPLAKDLAARVETGRQRLRAFQGAVALYGANAYSQALLGLFPHDARYTLMLDDTPMYEGQRAYGPDIDIPIQRPSPAALQAVDGVVITAYLHDAGIAGNVRRLGYDGPLYTARADSLAGTGDRPEGLFRAAHPEPAHML
jgi:SAM-dependent methyltransferase